MSTNPSPSQSSKPPLLRLLAIALAGALGAFTAPAAANVRSASPASATAPTVAAAPENPPS
jgi:hypothetical protein